jgi:hypothetical protein
MYLNGPILDKVKIDTDKNCKQLENRCTVVAKDTYDK